MNTPILPLSEERLNEVASGFSYPPTPDVAGVVIARIGSGNRPRVQLRSAWVVTGLLVLVLAILFAVPSVRAEIIRFFQVGVVRIFPSTPTQTAEPSVPQVPRTATPIAATPNEVTPIPGVNVPFYAVTISGLAGETSFEDVQARLSFQIRLPEYPADLGTPDRVFLQEDGEMVILIWTDPDNPESARLSLHEIGPGKVVVSKFEPPVIQETQVNGVYAIWTQGPYLLQVISGVYEFRRLVEGKTLIWEQDEITYRLETDLTLKEALRIAESLK